MSDSRATDKSARWFDRSQSIRAQYFSPPAIANIFADAFAKTVTHPTNAWACDLTCGTGRLLKPFVKHGFNVLGVEIDKVAAESANRQLGADSVRRSDLMDYAGYLPRGFANVMVLNPPYNLQWEVPHWFPIRFTSERYGASGKPVVTSELAVIEIAAESLCASGWLAAIMPVDDTGRTAETMARVGLTPVLSVDFDNLFKDEYKIAVKTTVWICFKATYLSRTREAMETFGLNADDDGWVDTFKSKLDGVVTEWMSVMVTQLPVKYTFPKLDALPVFEDSGRLIPYK